MDCCDPRPDVEFPEDQGQRRASRAHRLMIQASSTYELPHPGRRTPAPQPGGQGRASGMGGGTAIPDPVDHQCTAQLGASVLTPTSSRGLQSRHGPKDRLLIP